MFYFLKWFRLVLSEGFERVLHIQDGLGRVNTLLHVTPQTGTHDSTKAEDRGHLYDEFVSPPRCAIMQIANCIERAGCVVQFVWVLGADARNEGQMEGINDMWRVVISQACQCTLQVALSSLGVAGFKRKLRGELAKSVSIKAE